MTLFLLVWPEAMVTEDRGTFKSLAKNLMQASLARPSTGGVVSETFRVSPSSPVMAFFLARGWTLMEKLTPWSDLWIANIENYSVTMPKILVILSEAKNLCILLEQALSA
jgi:hypothetical protein